MYKAVKVGGILIGVYLLGAYATGWGNLLSSAGTSGSGVIKAFQGRG